jgi:hypothetical protein
MGAPVVSESVRSFGALDKILADSPFGNSDYITRQLHVGYKRRLGKIAAGLPEAGWLLDAIDQAEPYAQYRVIGDTVLRCAVQHAFTQLETGSQHGLPLQQCREIFQAAICHLEAGRPGLLGSELAGRLGPQPYHGWVWSEDRPDDAFARAFRDVVRENYAGALCAPGSEEIAMLAKGARLLEEILPHSSRSALSHTHLIAIFPSEGAWTTTASSSEFRLSGTIFLSRKHLSDPWWVADHLLHETLHQQLYDLRHGHSLLTPDFDREDAPKVCSLWNVPSQNYWDTHRALAAFHVYVYLALFSTLAEQRRTELEGTYGSLKGSKSAGSAKSLQRAHYLGEQLTALCWEELGPAGKRFVDLLKEVLCVLDPSPPPAGSCVHLLLDRYRKEAKKVETLLKNADRPQSLPLSLMTLAEDEVRGTRSVLAAVNSETELGRFDDTLARFATDELGTQFARIRGLIARTILNVSPDGFTLSESRRADEMVKTMVETSSERLKRLLQPADEAAASGPA